MIHHDYVNYVPEYKKRILRRMQMRMYAKAFLGAVALGLLIYLLSLLVFII